MPTLIEQPKSTSSERKSRFDKNNNEPKVLTKFDTKPHRNEKVWSILDNGFKSDCSDTAIDDELQLDKPFDEKDENTKFEPRKYDGFQVKVLPTKDRLIIRNQFLYMDPSTFSIVWHNIGLFIILHSLGFLGIYQCYAQRKFYTFAISKCILLSISVVLFCQIVAGLFGYRFTIKHFDGDHRKNVLKLF